VPFFCEFDLAGFRSRDLVIELLVDKVTLFRVAALRVLGQVVPVTEKVVEARVLFVPIVVQIFVQPFFFDQKVPFSAFVGSLRVRHRFMVRLVSPGQIITEVDVPVFD